MHCAGRDRFKASPDHTASSHQQPKKNLAKTLGREHTGQSGRVPHLQTGRKSWQGRRRGLGFDTLPLPAPTLLLGVLMAGIEVNIPVTYGIDSQGRAQSTGCQFIGQSPVHSILAACRLPTTPCLPGLRTAMSVPPGMPTGCGSSSSAGTSRHPR